MNPLAPQKYSKQPPLITEEAEEGVLKRRPFSNCVLFVLLAVFIFFLGCFAVYIAISMGVPVEKSQPAPTKAEALTKNGSVISEGNNHPPEETNKTESRNESDINSSLRIQILFKGKDDAASNKEFLEQDQNKTEDNLISSFPKGRIIVRKFVIRKDDLFKPEVDSTEEASIGSEEDIKDVIKMKSDAPNPLDILFNLLKFPEDPLENILKTLMKPRSEKLKVFQTEQDEKIPPKSEESDVSKDQVEELLNVSEKIKNEPQTTVQPSTSEKSTSTIKKPKVTKDEPQEKWIPTEQTSNLPNENDHTDLDETDDLPNTADHMITNIQQKGRDNQNGNQVTPVIFRNPFVRIFKFPAPQNNVGKPDIFFPMPPRNPFLERNTFHSNSMMRLPFSPLSAEDKGSSSGENSKMDESGYTVTPITYTTKPTSSPIKNYPIATTPTTTNTRIPTSRVENKINSRESLKEMNGQDSKDTPNKMKAISYRDHLPTIDGINTENIQPYENFINTMYRV